MVSPIVSRSRTSTMAISLLGLQLLRPRGCGCVRVDISARVARHNPGYHAGAVLACRRRRSRFAVRPADRWRWERIYGYDKPTIAMVHGYCVGGAFMQLLACDFAIAAENATFSLSEVNWGILPGALVSKVVSDMVLPRHALYYACLGDAFDGKEAARIGMINYAVPLEKLEDATTELA